MLTGKRILTNAHIVKYALFVQVVRASDRRRFAATVAHVDHASELAALHVPDPEFWSDVVGLELGELPERGESVHVYGFPHGGDEVAASSGVISRIEVRRYVHGSRRLLSIQTDAVVAAGSSGGPAVFADNLIGIVFQRRDSERIGYLVPSPIIRRFLLNIDNGSTPDVPDLGVYWQRIDSRAIRQYLGMKDETGVFVARVVFGSAAHSSGLQEGDVLLSIDGLAIGNDGSTPLCGDRVEFTHLVTSRRIGERSLFRLRRGKRTLDMEVSLAKMVAMVPP